MKTYKKVEMVAKNAPSGSYAAGCPTHTRAGNTGDTTYDGHHYGRCTDCEIAS